MVTCGICQAQVLEYVYDVLDQVDRQAVEAHLVSCPACVAALERARQQQKLLATAARLEFPQVRFEAPAVLPVAAGRSVRRRRVFAWAAAAAVLLVLGLPALKFGADYRHAVQVVAENQRIVAAAESARDAARRKQFQAPEHAREKFAALQRSAREKQVKLVVSGPATVSAGAPAEFQIETKNLNDQLVSSKVLAEVKDGDRSVGQPIAVPSAGVGKYRVTLPHDLPVRPNTQLNLVVSAKLEGGSMAELREQLQLAGPVYLTHLATDKPMYQPGEVVRFRSLTVNRTTLKPAEEDFRLSYSVAAPTGQENIILQGSSRLTRAVSGVARANNPANNLQNNAQQRQAGNNARAVQQPGVAEVLGPDRKPLHGIGAGEFPLGADAPGGEYTLIVRDELGRFPEQRRKFLVNHYQPPRLNKELDFSRKTYGPGDEVLATCKVTRADGGPLARRPVTAVLNVDGEKYDARGERSDKPMTFTTDDKGTVLVRCKLPARIEKGLASLALTFDDGGNVEPLVRPVPIVLKKLQVEFFPEGGDLVAGLNNRVYFQVKTTLGKPADLRGRILEDGKALPLEVKTLSDEKLPGVNQGMGKFEFTPKVKARYALQVDSPVGIADQHPLPVVRGDGVVLSVPGGVYKADGEIRVSVQGPKERALLVGLYCRGRLLDSVRLAKGQTEAVLKPAAGMGGVCRVTVFEELATGGRRRDLRPIAERLVYREPLEWLNLAVRSDRKSYVPGQKATVTIGAMNEKEEKSPAIVMVSVVDKSVITLADEKTARSMPTHFLLTTEVRKPEDLEYADFLLSSDPKAAEALDLLLGTQGWRRFAEQDPEKFRQQHHEEAERLLVTIGQSRPQKTDSLEREVTRIREDAKAQIALGAKEYAEAEEQLQQARNSDDYKTASASLVGFHKVVDRGRAIGVPVVAAMLVGAALIWLGRAIAKGFSGMRVGLASVAGCAAFVMLALWTGAVRDTQKRTSEKQVVLGGQVAPHAPVEKDLALQVDAMQGNAITFVDGTSNTLEYAAGDERVGGGKGMPAPTAGAAPAVPAKAGGGKKAAAAARGRAGARFGAMQNRLQDAADKVDKQAGLAGKPGQAKGMKDALPAMNADRKAVADAARAPLALRAAAPLQDADGKFAGKGEAQAGERQERGGMNGRRMLLRKREQLGREDEADLAPLPPLVVREYAHQAAPGTTAEQRSDFSETLFWHPVLVLDGGQADFSFDLCDSVTSFQVTAFAHTLDGRLGAATYVLDSRLPLTVQPKVPVEVTAGDRVDIPLSVANNTDINREVEVSLRGHENVSFVGAGATDRLDVPAGAARRRIFRFRPGVKEGQAVLSFEGKTAGFPADAVRGMFRIVPEGFPIDASHSDMLEGVANETVNLPETWVPGTLKCEVNVYPSTLADLQKGLEGLLREPGGCFEQTSSSNYPNLLVLDYLRESDQAKPEVERRAREMLARGYQKLVAFECPSTPKKAREGFEWFGGRDQGHEALTAYGLLQFRDLSRVQEVDPAMLQRTREFLLEQRDGKGGFKRNPRALDSFGRAPDEITNAYIVWSLTETGPDDVKVELNALAERAQTSTDPYFLALVANSLINRARAGDGVALLKKVATLQKPDGHLDAGSTSITGSAGRDLQIETTALAVLGWLKANNPAEFNRPVQNAIKWIGAQRGGYGGFGSTQSTILALKSLIAFARANKKTPEAGTLKLLVDGKVVGERAFPAGATEALTLAVPEAEKQLRTGKNKVRVEITGKNAFPYTLSWSYRSLQPLSAEHCPVRLETKLARTEAGEGDVVRLTARIENATDKGQGMAVAIVGLPGGLTVPEDLKQLKEYARLPDDGGRPLVGAFEIRGRDLVLYWRDLAPRQKIEVPIDLVCRVPGEYTGPASRAYLYYNGDSKHWVEPMKMTVTAKVE